MIRKPSPLAFAVALALAAPVAHAQETSRSDAQTLDTLIVTGTRVADRTVAESTAPIDIITPEVLQSTGTVELATALSRAVPSLNFPRAAINDGTDAMRPAQLRGLAPDHTLVLVNGKRYHPGALVNANGSQGRSSSPVDLNSIPIAAIERVEVLRDGASAQYGSDAIAGVINIVLKSAGSGGSVTVSGGQYSAGDGANYQVLADTGFKLGESGKLHVAVQGGHQDQTDRARPFLGTVTATSAPGGRVVQRYGDPEVDNRSFLYNGEVDVTDYLTFYSYGLYTRRETRSNGFFRPAGDERNIPSIYPDGFLPDIFNTSTDVSVSSGLKTSTDGGTNIDISYTYGANELQFDIQNTLNRTLGPTSPTDFYAGALELRQHVLNLDFSKALDWGLAYPVTLSWGAEWRGEKFVQSPGEPASYADLRLPVPGTSPVRYYPPYSQVFPGFKPEYSGSYDRNNISFYAGLEGDVTDKLSLGIAARYEDYSDFGDTATGKLTGRYAFNDAVALRATASTGFHAPSLQQQYFQAVSTNNIGGTWYDIVTLHTNNPVAIALGSEPLKAEESENLSLGLVLTPAEGLYVTIDAYQIKVTDRITLSENLTSPGVRIFVQSHAGYEGASGARYFTNAIDTTTQGVDIVGTYKWALANSALDFTAGYNYNKTEIDRVAPNPASLTAIDPTALRFGRVELARFEVGAPRDKFFLNNVWTRGGFSISTTATRYGEFTILNSNPVLDQTFGAKWLFDLAFSYKTNGWEFTVGGDNVLDEYPDENLYISPALNTSTTGQLPYPSQSPFGFNGAYMYARIGYKW